MAKAACVCAAHRGRNGELWPKSSLHARPHGKAQYLTQQRSFCHLCTLLMFPPLPELGCNERMGRRPDGTKAQNKVLGVLRSALLFVRVGWTDRGQKINIEKHVPGRPKSVHI